MQKKNQQQWKNKQTKETCQPGLWVGFIWWDKNKLITNKSYIKRR